MSPTEKGILFFPEASDPFNNTKSVLIPRFDASQDREGVASHVPHMDHFYDNSLQTGLMRDIAIDLEIVKEHLVLLGNQVRYTLIHSLTFHRKCLIPDNRASGRIKLSIDYAR